jgi:D-glycero-D-manno-heptose 1,7-bisphosphate phosphatase
VIGPSDRVAVLDRDGTIVIDRGYLADPAGLEFEPGAVAGLRWFYSHAFRLVVITNQSGVGRGLFTIEQLQAMNARLMEMVESAGARLERIYFCPHAPSEFCECRKPALGLMRRAASELGFEPACTVVIGDKESDIEFGRRAGATTILISRNAQPGAVRIQPHIVAPSLAEAARAMSER